MTTSLCNSCAACCSPVSLGFSQSEVATHPERFAEDNWNWILDHLTPITRREALARQPWLKDARIWQLDIDGVLTISSYYYDCDNFDPRTRMCLDWENRPGICRDFPWPEGRVDTRVVLPPRCGYRVVLGQEIEPTPVSIQRKI